MYQIKNEDVVGCDLISVEEAIIIPQWICANTSWWWLRSPGYFSHLAAYVNYDGSVDNSGINVYYGDSAVRPALQIKNLPELEVGDLVNVLGLKAQYIGDDKVLLCGPLFYSAFDYNSNEYETSEVKKRLDEWFVQKRKGD